MVSKRNPYVTNDLWYVWMSFGALSLSLSFWDFYLFCSLCFHIQVISFFMLWYFYASFIIGLHVPYSCFDFFSISSIFMLTLGHHLAMWYASISMPAFILSLIHFFILVFYDHFISCWVILWSFIQFHDLLLGFWISRTSVLKFDPCENWLFDLAFLSVKRFLFFIFFFSYFIDDNVVFMSNFISFFLYLIAFQTSFLRLLEVVRF